MAKVKNFLGYLLFLAVITRSYIWKRNRDLLGIQGKIEDNEKNNNVGQITCVYFKVKVTICNLRWKTKQER